MVCMSVCVCVCMYVCVRGEREREVGKEGGREKESIVWMPIK